MTSRTATRSKGRQRRAIDKAVPGRRVPAVIDNIVAVASNTIRITFATNVMPTRLPAFVGGAGGASVVETMNQISTTEIELIFTDDVDDSTMIVPENDPGIRTSAGGFVPAGNYAVPAAGP